VVALAGTLAISATGFDAANFASTQAGSPCEALHHLFDLNLRSYFIAAESAGSP